MIDSFQIQGHNQLYFKKIPNAMQLLVPVVAIPFIPIKYFRAA